MNSITNILVVRLSSLGDVILTFPFLKVLRNYFRDSHISFLTKSEFVSTVEMNPNVNKVIQYNPKIKLENYDFIFDLQNNLKSNLLVAGKSNQIFRYQKNNLKKFLLVKFKSNQFKSVVPVYKKYINTLKSVVNLKPEDNIFTVTELLFIRSSPLNIPYIIVAPSSKHFTKRYPKELFVELLKPISQQYKIILTGSNSEIDKEICNFLNLNIKNSENLCGLISIPELTSYIYNSQFVISNDSAVMHLSEAVGKKVFAIFGSTVKEFGFFPQLVTSEVFEVSGLKCRPCSHIGRSMCPEGHFKCMIDNPVIKNLNYKTLTL